MIATLRLVEFRRAGTVKEFRSRVSFTVILVAITTCAGFLVWQARIVLLLLFAGCICAIVLDALISLIEKRLRVSRRLSYALTLILLGVAIGLGTWLRGPVVANELSTLRTDIPVAASKIVDSFQQKEWIRWMIDQSTDPTQVSRGISFVLSKLGGAMATTASLLGGALLIVLTGIYLAAEPAYYWRGLQRLVPPEHRSKFMACVIAAVRNLRFWLLARLVSMTVIGAIVAAGLWILDVPLAGTLGVIAALLTFVPNLGPVLSAVPAVLLAVAISPMKGLLTVLVLCVAHFLEGNLITPLADRAIVKLPPVLTLSSQLVLVSIAGPLGLALAAPILAATIGVLDVLLPPLAEDPPPCRPTLASTVQSF